MSRRCVALGAWIVCTCLCGSASRAAASVSIGMPEPGTVAWAAAESMPIAPAGFGWPSLPDLPDMPDPAGTDGADDWDWATLDDRERTDGKKSPMRAVTYSALMPGMGERYLGNTRRAAFSHILEGAIWSTFAFYRIQGDRRQDRQVEFAQLHAAAPGDRDSDYYEHIGLWLSLEEWHDIVRRDARFNHPDDQAAQAAYFEENKRFGQGDFWDWDSDDSRIRYRQLRSRSERSFRNARLAIGAAVVHRVASMAQALALTRSYNKRVDEEHAANRASYELRIGPKSTQDGLVVGPILTRRY